MEVRKDLKAGRCLVTGSGRSFLVLLVVEGGLKGVAQLVAGTLEALLHVLPTVAALSFFFELFSRDPQLFEFPFKFLFESFAGLFEFDQEFIYALAKILKGLFILALALLVIFRHTGSNFIELTKQ
jgi:hypothetical protein